MVNLWLTVSLLLTHIHQLLLQIHTHELNCHKVDCNFHSPPTGTDHSENEEKASIYTYKRMDTPSIWLVTHTLIDISITLDIFKSNLKYRYVNCTYTWTCIILIHIMQVLLYNSLIHVHVHVYGKVSEKRDLACIIKKHNKNALLLKCYNFRRVNAIVFLFSALHITPFLYGKILFGILHLLLASIATFDTPPGSNPP